MSVQGVPFLLNDIVGPETVTAVECGQVFIVPDEQGGSWSGGQSPSLMIGKDGRAPLAWTSSAARVNWVALTACRVAPLARRVATTVYAQRWHQIWRRRPWCMAGGSNKAACH
jgi:hypothetical protein